MKRCTFSIETWACIDLRGEYVGPGRTRDDDGLVSDFLAWMMKEKIEWVAQTVGGGVFVGRVPTSAGPRVEAWLRKRGAEPATL